jgi:SAM-dependent methyltransferase
MSKKILNLGCGKGQNIPSLLNRGEIYCVDINEDFVRLAKKKFPTCNYIVSSAEKLKFESSFFDEIYCFDVLEHVDDLNIVIKNLHQFLKKEGVLFVEVPYDESENMLLKIRPSYFEEIGHKRIFDHKKLSDYFQGFKITKIEKTRGIVNLYLWILFKLNIGLSDQMSGINGINRIISRIVFMFTIWFDKNLFNTFLKYVPIWIITIPLGDLISSYFPKTVFITLKKQ